MRKHVLHCGLIVLAALLVSSAYAAVPEYEVIDLGALGAGETMPTGINNLGQIVGHSSQRIFLWQDGLMTDLGVQSEFAGGFIDINNKGVVAGSYIDSSYYTMRAFIWDNIEGLRPVEMPESFYTLAMGINDHNQVALTTGIDMGGFAEWYVYLYTEGEEPIDLGFPEERQTIAYGLSNAGHVVGFYFYGDVMHAFMWYQGEAMDLPALGGESSGAIGVNDEGIVVGMAETADGGSEAVMWSDGEPIELGGLGGNGSDNIAVAINNSGVIVGTAETSSAGEHAFVWTDGEMRDLNELIDPDLGVELMIAYAINENGWIAAAGFDSTGHERGYLVRPAIPTIVDFEITGPNEITNDSSAQYQAIVRYSDGSEKDVTELAEWWTESDEFGTISEGGMLTTGDVRIEGQIAVCACYTEDDAVAEADKVVIYQWVHPVKTAIQNLDAAIISTGGIAASILECKGQELMAREALDELQETGGFGLAKGDIVKAGQKILSATQHQQHAVDILGVSVWKLEDSLMALGVEYAPPEMLQEDGEVSAAELYNFIGTTISEAIETKSALVEAIEGVMDSELAAYQVLEQALAAGDYGDLAKGDVIKAMQRIHSAIQHDQQCINALEQAIKALQEALDALRWEEPLPPQI